MLINRQWLIYDMKRTLFTFLMIWIFSANAIAAVSAVYPHMTAPSVMDQGEMERSVHQHHLNDASKLSQSGSDKASTCETDDCASNHDCGNCLSHCNGGLLVSVPSFAPQYTSHPYDGFFHSSYPLGIRQRLLRPPRSQSF